MMLTKKPSKKMLKQKRNTNSTVRVYTNIGVLPSGNYRARKMVNGVPYSKNFTSLKACRNWLKNI